MSTSAPLPPNTAPAPAAYPLPNAAPAGDTGARAATVTAALGDGSGFNISDFLSRALLKHMGLALLVAAVVAGVGLYVTVRLPGEYMARAVVEIEPRTSAVLDVKQVMEDGSANPGEHAIVLETQRQIMRSRTMLQSVVDRLDLANDPQFMGVSEIDAAERAVALRRGDPVAVLAKRVEVRRMRDTNLLEIVVHDKNPNMAALIANTLADSVSERNLTRRMEVTWSAARWLEEQTEELRKELDVSEKAVIDFKKENEILSLSFEDRIPLLPKQLEQTASQLSQARMERTQLEALYKEAKRLDPNIDLDDALSFKPIAADESVRTLRASWFDAEEALTAVAGRYGESHPQRVAAEQNAKEARERLVTHVKSLLVALRRDYEQVAAVEKSLARELDALKSETLNTTNREAEYSRLLRQRDTTQRLYDQLLNRFKETNLQGMLKENNIRVADRAIAATKPARPNRILLSVLSVFAGVLGAVILVAVLEGFDTTVKFPEDVERNLGVQLLGALPAFEVGSTLEEKEGALIVARRPRSQFAESVRFIRTNLGVHLSGKRVLKLAVSSAFPSEGKTTCAGSLAVSFSQAGYPTVLVDCDLRKPRVHKAFGIANTDKRGTTESILGLVDPLDCTQTTEVAGLDILTYGSIPQNPAELLGSDGFVAMVERLATRYDRIVLDLPPIVSVTDAKIVALLTDGLVVVTRFNRTPKAGLMVMRKQLVDMGVPVIGAIINSVDMRRLGYGYGYGYTYYRYYSYYRYNPAYASYYYGYGKYGYGGYGYGGYGGYGYGYGQDEDADAAENGTNGAAGGDAAKPNEPPPGRTGQA